MRRFLALPLAGCCLLLSPPGALAQRTASAQRALRSALSRSLRAAHGASGAYVVDLTTHRALFSAAPGTPRMPASVEKLYTTSTALLRFGPNANLVTSILGSGAFDGTGGWHGTLYLRGGGDPTFGSASFDNFAYGTGATMQRLVSTLIHQSGITSVNGPIVGDESYFDSLRGTPPTRFRVSSDVEGLLSALAYDRGLADEQGTAFQARPALFTAQRLAEALRSARVAVPAKTLIYAAAAPVGARLLATVHSPRMATLIQLTNTPSDNFFAEMLLKDVGASFGGRGSTAVGAAVVRAQLAQSFGIHPRLEDGSGLSPNDLTSPRDVVTLLSSLASNPPFVRSLSVAGISGTLKAGLQGTVAQGRCRGKTGTLHDVANLVGLCTATDGHQLAFAFLMNAVDPVNGHALEDRMTVALAKYAG
ncbi:MAG: D-alanyl-D-alanine carboxypeptidase/D-alanyl-D-alanine endopeptidase [Solirubrobacteraceae bacterium]